MSALIKESFSKMASVFNPAAAKGLDVVFQYEIAGDGGGTWHVIVKDEKCEVKEGPHTAPSVTMKMDGATYLAMISKQLNGMQAFMTGKLKVTGNMMLAQKIGTLFTV